MVDPQYREMKHEMAQWDKTRKWKRRILYGSVIVIAAILFLIRMVKC